MSVSRPLGKSGQELGTHIPELLLTDVNDGMVSDPGKHGAQIELRNEPVELRRSAFWIRPHETFAFETLGERT